MLSNKFKRIVATSAVLLLFTQPIYAAETLNIKANGLIVNLYTPPVSEQGTTMISLKELANVLKANYSWDITTKTAYISKDNTKIKFEMGKKVAFVNDVEKTLDVPAKYTNDIVMAPLRFVAETLGAKVNYDAKTNTISIDNGDISLSVLNEKQVIAEDAIKLTYADAVKRVVSKNANIKNLLDSVELLEQSEESTRYTMVTTPMPTSSFIQSMRSLLSLENQISNVPLNEKILADASEYMLRNSISKIEEYKMDIKSLEENIIISNINLKNTELKNSLGLVSELDFKAAKLAHEQLVSSLNLLRVNLKSEQQSLARLLDYDLKKEVVVEFKPEITPINVNIDLYITNKIDEDPSIKMKKKAVTEAEYAVNTTVLTVDPTSPATAELDRIKANNNLYAAQRALETAKLDMAKNISATYNSIKMLEEKEKSLGIDLEKAKDAYNIAVVNYEAGNITLLQVNQAKLGILKAEIDIEKNKYLYSNLIFSFERPYLSAGSSVGGQ